MTLNGALCPCLSTLLRKCLYRFVEYRRLGVYFRDARVDATLYLMMAGLALPVIAEIVTRQPHSLRFSSVGIRPPALSYRVRPVADRAQ